MDFDFDRVVDRRGTDSIKWERFDYVDREAPRDSLPLWVADMDFAGAPPILEALHERVDRGILGYTGFGSAAYRAVVADWYGRRFSWKLDPAAVVFSPGIVPAIAYLLELMTGRGEGVIIQSPVYHPFRDMVERHGRRVVDSPLRLSGERWEMDFEDLEAKARDPATRLMILCSPHNPVGRVWSEAELRRLASICLGNGVSILSDEIHGDLTRLGISHIPLARLFPGEPRIVTATSPSKTFNIAGVQVSHLVIDDPRLRDEWKRYVDGELGLGNPNAFALCATVAAYTRGEAWLDALRAYLDGNLAFMADFLSSRAPRARLSMPEGSYLAFPDLRAYGLAGAELVRRFSREGHVVVQDGAGFGPGGEGFVRVNVACPRSLLSEGLERMASVLDRL